MIEYTCEKCNRYYKVKQKLAGELFQCKACGHIGRIEIPATHSFLRDFDSLFMATDIYYMRALVR